MSEESEKTRRDVLTEDQPTSGLNPSPTSRPIREREEQPKLPQDESKDGDRRVLSE